MVTTRSSADEAGEHVEQRSLARSVPRDQDIEPRLHHALEEISYFRRQRFQRNQVSSSGLDRKAADRETGAVYASGGTIAFTRDPSGSLASTIGQTRRYADRRRRRCGR